MKRWIAIVNEAAGRRPTAPDAVHSALRDAGVDADMEVPKTPEEAVEVLVSEARDGRDHFILAGGDGTVNLSANALLPLGMDTPTIGVLPVGTGCDLLRTFGIPQDMAAAAHHLAGEDSYLIDAGTLEGDWGTRYFVNVAETGVGAAAVQTSPKIPRGFGSARYPLAFAARLPGFPKAYVKVTTERRTYESEALAVFMANAQFFGGGWNLAPKATLVDGVLDIQIINARKTQAPALLPKVIKGTHLTDPAVKRLVAAEFSIETDPVWPVEADGDLVGNTSVSGRVIPAAIRLKI